MTPTDRELGMSRPITRRDFIHDVGITALSMTWPLPGLAMPQGGSELYYPPTLTGLRGSHPGSFEVAHALAREGKRFENPLALDERYDLVVVGGGISGLAAAYFHRKLHGAQSRILILDNHDDFGGHAKRNEFHQGGPMRLAWGGTVNMEYRLYSDVANGLLRELGIDIPRLLESFDFNWLGMKGSLQPALLFDQARYGRDVLLRGVTLEGLEPGELATHVDAFPLPEAARAKLKAFLLASGDVLAELSPAERETYLHRTSYIDFLREHFDLPGAATQIFSSAPSGFWGLPAESLSVAECLQIGAARRARAGRAGEAGHHGTRQPGGDVPGRQQLDRAAARALADPGDLPGNGGRCGSVRHRDRAAGLRRARPARVRGAAAAQLHGSSRRQCRERRGRHRRLRERRAAAALRCEASRARLLQLDRAVPRAGSSVRSEGGARAVREAADAGGQYAVAQRLCAAEARDQGCAATGELPAGHFPGDRHQCRRLPPRMAARGSLRDAGLRRLHRGAARRG